MSISILATKLYIPPPRPQIVPRLRLIERLNMGMHDKLTLISAPAGFGKTTLVSEWVAGWDRPVAWLSLEEGDNDLIRFLTYLIAALQTFAPTLGKGVLVALQSPQPPPTEAILTALLNEIANLSDHFRLVLDDYHLIEAKPINNALTFLLEHLPPQMHLVITTREDPNLPLARLRVRNQLTELRAADLRFTPNEASDFLNQVMGLSLSAEDIATLENRTEGWIAGLQLAAISLKGHQDTKGFIRAFAGDHRYILDYLVGEVLERQPEPVRRFLIQTSILDRLNGALCNAVTGQLDGVERLKVLERGNFFVISLDDSHHWYRYHHLFAQVLYARLMAEQSDRVAILHRRASEWYEQSDMLSDAVRHALVAGDFERAATLIEQAVPAMRQSRQESVVMGWLLALPDELFHFRPVLSMYYAGVLLQTGKLEGVEARLRGAERWLGTIADGDERPGIVLAEMVVVNQEEFRSLPGWIAIYRAAYNLAVGNIDDTVTYAGQALDVLPEDNHLSRGAAAGLLGLAYWTHGELESGHRSYIECMKKLQIIGHISDMLGCSIALADILIEQGRLREAMSTYEHGLQIAIQSKLVLRGVPDMYVGMSQIHYERNDLKAAVQHLLKSEEPGEFAGLPQNAYRWRVAMARVRGAEGDLDGALDLLHEAERLYVSDFFPNVRPIPALTARAWIAQGRLGEALAWAHDKGLSVEDDLSYLREFEHITLCRVLLAQYQSDLAEPTILEAMGLLDRLLQAAEQGGRTRSVIEILMLQALAFQMQDKIPSALAPLERALTLAEPEGYVRMFVDEGSAIAILLEKAAKHKIAPNYVRQLLTAFGSTEYKPLVKPDLLEPLSEREMEVLRLLRTDLDGPEIASKLIVSLNTLRTHTKNIYTKFGVNSRRSAIRRAEELNLL